MKKSKSLTAILLVMILAMTSLTVGCKKNDAGTSGEATTSTGDATTT